jgi:hypothetical protein
MTKAEHGSGGTRRLFGRRGVATSYLLIGALASVLILALTIGWVLRRVSDVRLRLTDVAVAEARHWSSQAVGSVDPPQIQIRVRDAVRRHIKEVEAMRVEVVERPDPGLAGMDQYVVRIYARTHPVDWLRAEFSWTMQVEGVFTRLNDYRPGDLLRRARTSAAEDDFPSWR